MDGGALAAAVCLLMPDRLINAWKRYQFLAPGAFTGLLADAFLLRTHTAGNHYAKRIAYTTVRRALVGGFVWFAIRERYVSTAKMRAVPFTGRSAGAIELVVRVCLPGPSEQSACARN